MTQIFRLLVTSVLLFGSTYAFPARASDYPSRPVKVIVPFPAGGLVDTVMRIVTDRLSGEAGQAFIIENRGGAAGSIATATAARAPADGYTIIAVTDSHATNPLAMKNLPYDSVADFAPVALIGMTPLVLTVAKDMPSNTVSEFVELAKAKKSAPLSYGSLGPASAPHLASELFRRLSGTEFIHVPYKGGAPAINDLLAGHINSMFLSITVSKSHFDAGSLKALAVAGDARLASLPNVPTMAEAGFPIRAAYWIGILVPRNTPAPAVATLSNAIEKTLVDPAVRQRLGGMDFVVAYKNPRDFGEYILGEMKFWEQFAKDNKIQFIGQ